MIVKHVSKVNKPDHKPIFTTQSHLLSTLSTKLFISEKKQTMEEIVSLIEEKTQYLSSYSIGSNSPKYWSITQEMFERLDKLCDDKLFWELNQPSLSIWGSNFSLLSSIEANTIFFKSLTNLRSELFFLFLTSFHPQHSFFSKGIDFSNFQRLLIEKEQRCSEDEVEWLKLLNITHQMDWLMANSYFKNTSKQEWSEDLSNNFKRWSNLFCKLDKVERDFKQNFYKFLVDKNREGCELTCSYERITLILKYLQSLKNIDLLKNAFWEYRHYARKNIDFKPSKQLELILKYLTFRFDKRYLEIAGNSLEDDDIIFGNKCNLLCIYLYFLKKEEALCEEIFYDLLNRCLSKQELLRKINTLNDFERFKMVMSTDLRKFEEIQDFNKNYKIFNYPTLIDFTSSDLRKFFIDFKIYLNEKDIATTPDWGKLMQSVQTSCQAVYLSKLFSWGIFGWDSWDGYSLEAFESTGIKLTELGLNSYDEINLYRRDFLICSYQWSKNDIYEALKVFQSIDNLDPKVINNPKVIALREKVPNLDKPEEILWRNRFQDCFLKECNEKLGFSIDDYTKTYGPERARIDHFEEWGIQHGPLIAGSNLYDPVIVKKKEQYKTQ